MIRQRTACVMQYTKNDQRRSPAPAARAKARSEVDDIPEVGMLRIIVEHKPKYGPGFYIETEGNSFRVVLINKDKSVPNPAEAAGLRNGDLLLELNGEQVVDQTQIKKVLKAKESICVSVLRVFDFSAKADSDEESDEQDSSNWDAADLFNPTMLQFWCVVCSANKKLESGVITSAEVCVCVCVCCHERLRTVCHCLPRPNSVLHCQLR